MSKLRVVLTGKTGDAGSGVETHESHATILHVISCTSATRPGSPVEGQPIYETDTDTYKWWDGDSWEDLIPDPTAGDGPGGAQAGELICLAELTSDQTIETGAEETVIFDTVHVDVGSVYNNVNGIITLPVGLYVFEYSAAWDTNSNGRRQSRIAVASGTVLPDTTVAGDNEPGATAGVRQSISGGCQVTAEATFSCKVWQNSGANRTIGSKDDGDVPGRTTLAITYCGQE